MGQAVLKGLLFCCVSHPETPPVRVRHRCTAFLYCADHNCEKLTTAWEIGSGIHREGGYNLTVSRKEISAGAMFIAFGFAYGYQSAFGLQVGTVRNMGPGLFPLALSIILFGIGLAVAFNGLQGDRLASKSAGIPWRPICFISAATVCFALFATTLGMLPVTFLTTFIASFARKQTRVLPALFMSACIAVFCSLLFTYGLGLPLPVFGSLFRS